MNGYWHYVTITGLLGFALSLDQGWWILPSLVFCMVVLRWFTLPRLPYILCLFSFISPLILQPYTTPSSTSFPKSKEYWSGTIINAPEKRSDFTRFTIKDEEHKWIVYAFQPYEGFKYGASCHFRGTAEEPDESRNPGDFDYKKYLHSKEVKGIITIEGAVSCSGQSFLSHVFQIRRDAIQHIRDMYSDPTASWVIALVFGDDRFLDQEHVDLFRRWNLSHLLAISGLHVGLFIAFFSYLGIRFGWVTKEKLKALLMVLLPFYCLIAGAAPSVIRATFMAIAIILMTFLQKRWRITDVLSIGVLVVLWFSPSLLFQLGFQFSFLVTFALLLSKNIFLQSPSFFVSLLRVSLVSQLAILPIQLHAFYTYNPLSILINLIYIPAFSFVVLPYSLILIFFSFLPPFLSKGADLLFQIILSFALDVLEHIDEWIFMEIVTGKLLISVIVLYYIGFIFMMGNWTKEKYQRACLYGGILVLLLMFDAGLPYLSNKGRVTMLDVGQGDTFVIEWPYRERVMMIDAAGAVNSDEDKFKHIIEPYLLSRGIHQVDVLVLTHHDLDHMGSGEGVMNRFHVRKVVTSPFYEVNSPIKHHVKVDKGDVFRVGPTSFHVVHPDRDRQDTNDNSLVLHTAIGGKDWLFTGDVSADVEETLQGIEGTDVLKVSHHGSRFSSDEEFLKRINPEIAWISVGEDNAHGHPSPEVLRRLQEQNVRVMRTDLYGAVYYEFSNGTGTFFRHTP